MLNACIATRGGPSSTWMLSVLLQPPFRPSIHLPGAMHGVVGYTTLLSPRVRAFLPYPLHTALWSVLRCLHLLCGFGELERVGLQSGGGSQELPRRPSSLLIPHPLSLHRKVRWHRDSGHRHLHCTPGSSVYLPEQSGSPKRIAEKTGSS